MSGHGHVTPNADGSKARCGGPGICAQCAREFAAAHSSCYRPKDHQGDHGETVSDQEEETRILYGRCGA